MKGNWNDASQMFLDDRPPADAHWLVRWWWCPAHVPPDPYESLAGTCDGGHQKARSVKFEPLRGVSQNKQQTQPDQPYMWGRPALTYLPFRAIVRLTILRSKLEPLRRERGTWLH